MYMYMYITVTYISCQWLSYTLDVISQAGLVLPEQPNSARPGAVPMRLARAATCLMVISNIQETHIN